MNRNICQIGCICGVLYLYTLTCNTDLRPLSCYELLLVILLCYTAFIVCFVFCFVFAVYYKFEGYTLGILRLLGLEVGCCLGFKYGIHNSLRFYVLTLCVLVINGCRLDF